MQTQIPYGNDKRNGQMQMQIPYGNDNQAGVGTIHRDVVDWLAVGLGGWYKRCIQPAQAGRISCRVVEGRAL